MFSDTLENNKVEFAILEVTISGAIKVQTTRTLAASKYGATIKQNILNAQCGDSDQTNRYR